MSNHTNTQLPDRIFAFKRPDGGNSWHVERLEASDVEFVRVAAPQEDTCLACGKANCFDHALRNAPSQKVEEVAVGEQSFQDRVQPWMLECFGAEIAADKEERNHRFLEEALELVQSCGATRSEAHQLVDYTFDRPVGAAQQEVGGVMVTLAALCLAQGFDMHACGEAELTRIWGKVETIRAKQAAKPKHSPLPEHAATTPVTPSDAARKAAEEIWQSQCCVHTAHPPLGKKRLEGIISRYLPVPVEEGDEDQKRQDAIALLRSLRNTNDPAEIQRQIESWNQLQEDLKDSG